MGHPRAPHLVGQRGTRAQRKRRPKSSFVTQLHCKQGQEAPFPEVLIAAWLQLLDDDDDNDDDDDDDRQVLLMAPTGSS